MNSSFLFEEKPQFMNDRSCGRKLHGIVDSSCRSSSNPLLHHVLPRGRVDDHEKNPGGVAENYLTSSSDAATDRYSSCDDFQFHVPHVVTELLDQTSHGITGVDDPVIDQPVEVRKHVVALGASSRSEDHAAADMVVTQRSAEADGKNMTNLQQLTEDDGPPTDHRLQLLGDVAAIPAGESKSNAVPVHPLPNPQALPASPSTRKQDAALIAPRKVSQVQEKQLVMNPAATMKLQVKPAAASSASSSSFNKLPCSSTTTAASGFNFKCEERAQKRRDFYAKLEERMKAKEEEKRAMEAKRMQEKEAQFKELRRALAYKANPVPSFYQEPPPPKRELKKVPPTRAKSPNFTISKRRSSDVSVSSTCYGKLAPTDDHTKQQQQHRISNGVQLAAHGRRRHSCSGM
ncbi:hypothetical protein CY35_17G048600 [Sphagnum magellanicum]|nr:hypothetical protein CY35_17G048600 [Sphagnum magellanicum]